MRFECGVNKKNWEDKKQWIIIDTLIDKKEPNNNKGTNLLNFK